MSEEEIINEMPEEQPAPVIPQSPLVTGMASSVLKAQTDAERKNMERAIDQHRASQEGKKSYDFKYTGLIVLVLIVLVLGATAVFKPTLVNKAKAKLGRVLVHKKQKVQPIIMSHDLKIKGTTATLTVLVSKKADKVTCVFSRRGAQKSITKSGVKKQTLGEGMLWETQITKMRKGSYTYKVFVHDPRHPDVGILTGNCTIK